MGEFGMPYMGSKSKIAMSICSYLPKADNFYDLFGGGGAITHCMATKKRHKYKTFTYNDIQPGNADIIKRAIAGEFSYDRFKPAWVSREDFNRLKDEDPYLRIVWSFGNDQKTYMFGSDIEPYKKSMHNAVVFGIFDDRAKSVLGFDRWPKTFPDSNIKRRRLYLRQKVKFNNKKMSESELQQLEQLERLQQLERLEQLERLQKLEQVSDIEILSKSYDQVDIKENSVIYCDPPYQKTKTYLNSFDHKKFLDWAANINHPVFISEYDIKDRRFQLVYKINKRPMMSASKTSMKDSIQEKLYWNGKL